MRSRYVTAVSPRAGTFTRNRVRVEESFSAGTELGMYRGTNPYLDRRWDAEMAMFFSGGATFSYPLDVWGYSEVGAV